MFSQSTRRICPPSRASYRAPLGVKICKYVYLYYASTNMYFIRSRAAPTLRNVVGDIRDEDGRNKRRRAWARACSGTGTGETPGHQNLMRPQSGSPGLGAYAANAGACAPSAARRSLPDLAARRLCPALLPSCYRLPTSPEHDPKRRCT